MGTSSRLGPLRTDYLIRDRYRCVISRKFRRDKFFKRIKENHGDPRDDNGYPLDGDYAELEATYIVLYSLIKSRRSSLLVCFPITTYF